MSVFDRKSTSMVVFDGVGASAGNGGGMTEEFFGAGFSQITDIMSADGSALVSSSANASYNSNTGWVQCAGGEDLSSVPIGLIANIIDGGYGDFEVPDRYEVLEVDAANNKFRVDTGLAPTALIAEVTFKIGGAFDSFLNAYSNCDAGRKDVTIFTNLAQETISAVISAGSIANNSYLTIAGYYSLPGDMDPGGANYQTIMDIRKNGINANSFVSISATGSVPAIKLSMLENIRLRNFELASSSSNFGIELSGECVGVDICHNFFDCEQIDGTQTTNSASRGIRFHDNYLQASTDTKIGIQFSQSDVNCVVCNNIFENCRAQWSNGGSGILAGNLILGPYLGAVINGDIIVLGNTIYGCSQSCIRMNNASYSRKLFNNILMPVQSGHVIEIGPSGGTVDNDHNLIWSCDAEGVPTVFAISEWGGGEVASIGDNSIEGDPLFDSDYLPGNPDVISGGIKDVNGKSSQIGAAIRECRFAGRSRVTNYGRMSIIR